MNTNQSTQTNTTEQAVKNLIAESKITTPAPVPAENKIIMHEAEIITPQPYGVYALCKIMEHFQIN